MKYLHTNSIDTTASHREFNWSVSFSMYAISIFVLILMLSNPVLAQDGAELGDFEYTLCILVDFFKGNLGKGIATLAVVSLGIGALLGKVSWVMAISVAVGIAGLFSAPSLVASATNIGNICVR